MACEPILGVLYNGNGQHHYARNMWWAVANRRYRYSEYIKNLWDNIRCPPIITKGKGAGRDAHTEYSINWSKTGPKAQSKEQHLKNGTASPGHGSGGTTFGPSTGGS